MKRVALYAAVGLALVLAGCGAPSAGAPTPATDVEAATSDDPSGVLSDTVWSDVRLVEYENESGWLKHNVTVTVLNNGDARLTDVTAGVGYHEGGEATRGSSRQYAGAVPANSSRTFGSWETRGVPPGRHQNVTTERVWIRFEIDDGERR